MNENCEVQSLHKKVTMEEYQKTRLALLAVAGMGCPNCAARVGNSLIALYGVTNVVVDHVTGSAQITFNPDLVTFPALLEAVAQAGNDGRHTYQAMTVNAGW
ncbi:MAG TPA: heavy-metal-associated domain-containing protein [Chloroflexota bacterium]|nr:heavy-metal-associated domain-containing protein [Chloroflexota bacterium]HUM67237.1 heavy-metal-associated domain-containing protein [Chloroflexota bacterium]